MKLLTALALTASLINPANGIEYLGAFSQEQTIYYKMKIEEKITYVVDHKTNEFPWQKDAGYVLLGNDADNFFDEARTIQGTVIQRDYTQTPNITRQVTKNKELKRMKKDTRRISSGKIDSTLESLTKEERALITIDTQRNYVRNIY